MGGDAQRARVGAYFEAYGPMVYRRALAILGEPSWAKDALQEVFLRAFRQIDRFENRSTVSTWLYQITTNHCLNELRGRSRREGAIARYAGAVELPGAPPAESALAIRRLLAEADERQAQAAVYVFVDGLSREEVAEILGVSVRTVGNLLSRFTAWAKERLDAPVAGSGGAGVKMEER
jgi:RNA polymerase sigma-70 factor (ECF subfamily)